MKILFLDGDGVLNCEASPHQNGLKVLEDKFLLILKRIVNATGAKIVVSSSFRKTSRGRLRFRQFLRKFDMDYIDVTGPSTSSRSLEIETWLDAHPEVSTFAILDDDPGAFIKGSFFQTRWSVGLTDEIADKVITHLNKCSNCGNPAIQYLMHQAFCQDCGIEFTRLHKLVNYD